MHTTRGIGVPRFSRKKLFFFEKVSEWKNIEYLDYVIQKIIYIYFWYKTRSRKNVVLPPLPPPKKKQFLIFFSKNTAFLDNSSIKNF